MSKLQSKSPRDAHGEGKSGLRTLVLGAIGVVFGDIGTSPLYTIKEAFSPHYGLAPDHATVLGVLSLVFWSLMLVVIAQVRAGDHARRQRGRRRDHGADRAGAAHPAQAARLGFYATGVLGVFGAALFFGDGVLTPGHLGARRGRGPAGRRARAGALRGADDGRGTVGGVRAQRFGTDEVGKVFGPVIVLWFISTGRDRLATSSCARGTRGAESPWAVRFFATHGWHGFFMLGAVVLAVTGGEALYADMGHFGATRDPDRLDFVVLPGTDAQLLRPGRTGAGAVRGAVENPFYLGGAAVGALSDDRTGHWRP